MFKIIGIVLALLMVPSTAALVAKNVDTSVDTSVEVEDSASGVIETPTIRFPLDSSTADQEGTDQETEDIENNESTDEEVADDAGVELPRIPLSSIGG